MEKQPNEIENRPAESAGEGVELKTESPYDRFDRDVPEHLREDVMTAMCEATSGYDVPSVHILERDQLNACNHRALGSITIEGVEYSFQFESGDFNGSVLLDWEGEREFEYHTPTRYALQPIQRLISQAIESGKGDFLILKWDAILRNRPEVAAIPSKFAYDTHYQPGSRTSTYWREKAAKHLFDIVTEEEASSTRSHLTGASQ